MNKHEKHVGIQQNPISPFEKRKRVAYGMAGDENGGEENKEDENENK